MSIVFSKDIEEPKILVTPPKLVKAIVFGLLLILFVAIACLPMDSIALKIGILLAYGLVLLGIYRNICYGNYLVTMQGNSEGLFFQTDDKKKYFHVPWVFVGAIEKTTFPLNSRGLRIEVIGEYKKIVANTVAIGNVRNIENKIFIYTTPQLMDRDKLIDRLFGFMLGKT